MPYGNTIALPFAGIGRMTDGLLLLLFLFFPLCSGCFHRCSFSASDSICYPPKHNGWIHQAFAGIFLLFYSLQKTGLSVPKHHARLMTGPKKWSSHWIGSSSFRSIVSFTFYVNINITWSYRKRETWKRIKRIRKTADALNFIHHPVLKTPTNYSRTTWQPHEEESWREPSKKIKVVSWMSIKI